MSKKSKKQRAKDRKVQVRRESGIVLRAVTPPAKEGKLLVLEPKGAAPAPAVVEAPEPPPATTSAPAEPVPEPPAPAATPTAERASESPAAAPTPTAERAGESAPPAAAAAPEPREAEPPKLQHAPSAPREAEPSKLQQAPSAPVEEHRASRRVSLEVDIHLSSDSHFFAGLSGDISEGGLFVSTYRPLAVGTPVDLEFSLPGGDHTVQAKGEVRWIREHSAVQSRGVGIAFDELSDEDRDEIHAFCAARPPLYYEDVG